eukprot:scaffold226890_cov41-Prasinocladus_malaysianus.AAC.1
MEASRSDPDTSTSSITSPPPAEPCCRETSANLPARSSATLLRPASLAILFCASPRAPRPWLRPLGEGVWISYAATDGASQVSTASAPAPALSHPTLGVEKRGSPQAMIRSARQTYRATKRHNNMRVV